MLVAIKSFSWRDPDVGLIELTAGRDRVAADHAMLRDPHVRENFAELDSAAGSAAIAGTGTRKAAPSQASPAPSWRLPAATDRARSRQRSEPIELRERLGDHTVTIGPLARRLINQECFAYRRDVEMDGIEATGGGLFGEPIWGWHRQSYVASAIPAVYDCGRHELKRDVGEIIAHAGSLKRCSTHIEIGSWHPHPSSDGTPSPPDLQTWLSGHNWLKGGSRYVSLIATRGARGWASPPRLHAWVTYRDRVGDAICERAAVREVPGGRVAA